MKKYNIVIHFKDFSSWLIQNHKARTFTDAMSYSESLLGITTRMRSGYESISVTELPSEVNFVSEPKSDQ